MKLDYKRDRRVVVTGVGVIAPNGIGKETFWINTLLGKSGIVEIEFAKVHRLKSTVGGRVSDFDPRVFGLRENQICRLDRYVQFALAATKMAIIEAGLDLTNTEHNEIGVCIANAIGGTKHMEEEFLKLTENGKMPLNPTWAHKALFQASTFNVASAEIAYEYKFKGPCNTVPTGCAAGLDAIGLSLDLIRSGRAKVMITGASEAPLTPMVMAAFDAIGALSSKHNHTPSQASRPFDALRDGFVLGESCGILVLEEREHALRRKAPILAEIKGYGSTSNAYHMTSLPDNGADLARSIEIALQDAKIDPDEIDYINAHGSSTPQNDVNETAAYKKIFGKKANQLLISSLKSMCGHALAAANAIETIATICSIVDQKVHPTMNYSIPDPACDLNYVPNKAAPHAMKYALKNASGFSGIHSSIVLASHP